MPFKLIALVLPLSLDTFAVSAALGVAGLTARERWRLSLVMAGFEAGMPLVGFAAGGLVGRALAGAAGYAAAAALVGAGLLMLRDDDEGVAFLPRLRGLALVGAGLSVSMDELAIGLVIGLLGMPVAPVVVLVGLQAAVASQVGMRLGDRVGERLRERAERVAGGLLVLLGIGVAALELTGHSI